jgi:hypothetical protein
MSETKFHTHTKLQAKLWFWITLTLNVECMRTIEALVEGLGTGFHSECKDQYFPSPARSEHIQPVEKEIDIHPTSHRSNHHLCVHQYVNPSVNPANHSFVQLLHCGLIGQVEALETDTRDQTKVDFHMRPVWVSTGTELHNTSIDIWHLVPTELQSSVCFTACLVISLLWSHWRTYFHIILPYCILIYTYIVSADFFFWSSFFFLILRKICIDRMLKRFSEIFTAINIWIRNRRLSCFSMVCPTPWLVVIASLESKRECSVHVVCCLAFLMLIYVLYLFLYL